MELDLSYRDDGGRGLVVVSFDPGITTGWAVHRINLDLLVSRGFAQTIYDDTSGFTLGQLAGDGSDESEIEMAQDMMDIVRAGWVLADHEGGDLFAVVMEDFNLRLMSGDRSLLAPVRVFSRFETVMALTLGGGVHVPYFKQQVADAKNVVTDARLIRWNVYDKHSGEHARDAQRHGILFSRKVASVPVLARRCVATSSSS